MNRNWGAKTSPLATTGRVACTAGWVHSGENMHQLRQQNLKCGTADTKKCEKNTVTIHRYTQRKLTGVGTLLAVTKISQDKRTYLLWGHAVKTAIHAPSFLRHDRSDAPSAPSWGTETKYANVPFEVSRAAPVQRTATSGCVDNRRWKTYAKACARSRQ